MPTGHHTMQRPHPTHPAVPNCSHHQETLCDTHWRYRAPVEDRTGPPCISENPGVKQESHRMTRSAVVAIGLVRSTTVTQKQVGQTAVQLPQAMQRVATSLHPDPG